MKKIIYLVSICSMLHFYSFAGQVNITGLDGRKGTYNPSTKVASLGTSTDVTVYTHVVEYSKAVTPPSVENPLMQPFATMPNPMYKGSKKGPFGAQTKTITLYGISQYSTEANALPAITESHRSQDKSLEIYGSKGSYHPGNKTAYLIDVLGNKKEYTDVVEYRQAVTPPNIANPRLKPFATLQNRRYKENDKRLAGGQFKNIILYGIEKESENNELSDFEIKGLRDNF